MPSTVGGSNAHTQYDEQRAGAAPREDQAQARRRVEVEHPSLGEARRMGPQVSSA